MKASPGSLWKELCVSIQEAQCNRRAAPSQQKPQISRSIYHQQRKCSLSLWTSENWLKCALPGSSEKQREQSTSVSTSSNLEIFFFNVKEEAMCKDKDQSVYFQELASLTMWASYFMSDREDKEDANGGMNCCSLSYKSVLLQAGNSVGASRF